MIRKEQILSLEYYNYGGVFTGSLNGMRYRVEKVKKKDGQEKEEEVFFLVHVWKEPYNYDVTPHEDMKMEKFPFSNEGAQNVADWLNLLYEEEYKQEEQEE